MATHSNLAGSCILLKKIKSSISHHLEAWCLRHPSFSIWTPPPVGSFKVNFNTAIRPSFAVAAAILRDHSGNIMAVNTLKLPYVDANKGEAYAALLAVRLASSFGCPSIILEGGSLLTVLAIKEPQLFLDCNTKFVISNINLLLTAFSFWKVCKAFRCANICVHLVTRWTASNLVFDNISPSSPFLSFIRFMSGKDPLM
jgi:hypothetical protein